MRALLHRLLVAVSAAILFGTVWLMWDGRPQLPTVGGGGTERLLEFVAWLGGLFLVAGLLFRLLGRDRRGAPSLPLRNLRRRETRTRRGRVGGYADRAFPLIPTAGPAPATDADGAAGTPEPSSVDGHASPNMPVSRVVISLLGPPTVAAARKRGRGLRGATRELLCYLALRPAGAHRDQITDALWPEQTPEQARNRLWRAAADARAQLGEASLRRDGEHYQLNRTEISVDVDLLEQALTELSRSEDENGQLPLLEQALGLFTGEPLAGSDFPWAENDQRRLHAIRLDLAERTARALLARGDAADALARAEEGLASEPYNEKLARLAMQAEAALGLRAAVIGRYDKLSEILEEQLGLQPHAETRRLYRRLLGQDQNQDALPAARG